ncbi:DUF1800 domain-containing protein [Nocardioides litoris]|uniref:DUF1800 domain-containing protein n=1 Tax=Nocardioides litoris TaxID=1926648 RepID=UPI0011244A1D|nr:DUF1800 domain-containing protein [Nocardioides litoris]
MTLTPAPRLADDTGALTRRRLGRGLLGGLAVTAVAPALAAPEAEAASRAHRRTCRHFHRCPRHPQHTCRRLHRCKHRFHRARPGQGGQGGQGGGSTGPAPEQPAPTEPTPTGPTPEQPTPTEPTTPSEPPAPPAPDPDFVSSALPTAASLHLASRFTYGFTPALHEQMKAAGSPAAWFEQQLDPAQVPDSFADGLASWWTSMGLGPAQIWQRQQDGTEGGWVAMANYARWCLLRRIYSERQVLEVMAEFWENHLHIPLDDDGVYTYRADYGRALRAHTLGRYDDLLVTAITHPAMLISLDQARSTKRAPNENLGRELLELHTVGKGNHTEDDVKTSARLLTGYRVDTWSATWRAWYDPASHWTGTVDFLDFKHDNADPDGRAATEAYLRHLAHHPRTAERIARKLCLRFVSDTPSAALVAQLAQVFLDSKTAIKPVLRALVASAEFQAAAGLKVRTPTDDVVACHRALRTRIARPTNNDSSAANSILWQCTGIGHAPFGWPRPDGPPQDNASWSSVSRLLASFEIHQGMAGRWWPKVDMTYREPQEWMPATSMVFSDLVEHLSRQLLGKTASARLQQACREVVGVRADTVINANHPVVRWQFYLVLLTILDSPDHLHR